MEYIIYKTTNRINGKTYIGQHACDCNVCTYLGSGNLITAAVEKYGRENFIRETLFVCEDEEELNRREAELVTEVFVARDDNYNIYPGGLGAARGRKLSEAHKQRLREVNLGKKQSEETKLRKSRSLRGKPFNFSDEWRANIAASNRKNKLGKPHTEEHNRKIGDGMRNSKKYQDGLRTRHNATDRRWVTNGIDDIFLRNDQQMPEGFDYGRSGGKRGSA